MKKNSNQNFINYIKQKPNYFLYLDEIKEYMELNKNIFEYGKKRNNCGVVAADFRDFMNKKGMEFSRVEGEIQLDVPMLGKLDFYENELNEMKDLKLNPNDLKDRLEYTISKGLIERQTLVPHYWNEDKDGNVIDLSGYFQFYEKEYIIELSNDRYLPKNMKINHTIKTSNKIH